MSLSKRTGLSLCESAHRIPADHFPASPRVSDVEADRHADRLLELSRGELETDARESDRELVW